MKDINAINNILALIRVARNIGEIIASNQHFSRVLFNLA